MPRGRTRSNVSNIFYWNHVSDKLTLSEKAELKAYYLTNHRKFFAYEKAHKDFKKKKIIGNSLSVILASSGVAAVIATGCVALLAVSSVGLLIKGYIDHQNLDMKIQSTQYAYQSY